MSSNIKHFINTIVFFARTLLHTFTLHTAAAPAASWRRESRVFARRSRRRSHRPAALNPQIIKMAPTTGGKIEPAANTPAAEQPPLVAKNTNDPASIFVWVMSLLTCCVSFVSSCWRRPAMISWSDSDCRVRGSISRFLSSISYYTCIDVLTRRNMFCNSCTQNQSFWRVSSIDSSTQNSSAANIMGAAQARWLSLNGLVLLWLALRSNRRNVRSKQFCLGLLGSLFQSLDVPPRDVPSPPPAPLPQLHGAVQHTWFMAAAPKPGLPT